MNGNSIQLLKSIDNNKDQSYFLCCLNQNQLDKTLFPIGKLYKKDVRDLAKKAGLITHNKKDSTGICFIGEQPFRDFLSSFLKSEIDVAVTLVQLSNITLAPEQECKRYPKELSSFGAVFLLLQKH